MKECVIFDMDGILFDTERLCLDGWEVVARRHGFAGVEDVARQCIGRNERDTRQIVLNHYGQDFAYDAFHDEITGWMKEWMAVNGVPLKKGVREVLGYLRESGTRVGLASSSSRDTVERELRLAGIMDFFEMIMTGDRVVHSKPEPEIYLMACDAMGEDAGNVYAVEDSYNGIIAAYAAGMKPLLVPDLDIVNDEMRQKSVGVFNDLLEVRDFFEEQDKWRQ